MGTDQPSSTPFMQFDGSLAESLAGEFLRVWENIHFVIHNIPCNLLQQLQALRVEALAGEEVVKVGNLLAYVTPCVKNIAIVTGANLHLRLLRVVRGDVVCVEYEESVGCV